MASDKEKNRANAVNRHFKIDQAGDRHLDEAIAWHLRLASTEADEVAFLEFAAWLQSDPANRVAYDGLEDFDVELGYEISREGHQNLSHPLLLVGSPLHRHRSASVAAWVAGATALAAALLVFVLLNTKPQSPIGYMTGVGQSRTVALSDGSTIAMNTSTALSVQMLSGERSVILDRGEALFRVHHDRDRPFIVRVGDRDVRDIGTIFDVLRHNEVISVAVTEGQIGVAPAGGGEPVEMGPGERLRHVEGSSFSQLDTIDPKWVATWQSGYLVYRNATLREVVADLNRYFRHPIVVEASVALTPRFSGVLRIRNEDAAVAQLTAFLPIVAVREAGGNIRLQATKPKP